MPGSTVTSGPGGFSKGEESKVWCFVGDGECDEPEIRSLTLGSRENLDNLIWVINSICSAFDGPVRGNGKIIRRTEPLFNGWMERHQARLGLRLGRPPRPPWPTRLLLKRMSEVVDGDYQKYSVEPGSYTRKHFFGKYPELLELVNFLTDEQIRNLRWRPRYAQSLVTPTRRLWSTKARPPSSSPKPSRPGLLRPRRQEHHPPAEEAQRKGTPRVPRSVRHPHQR